MSRHDRIITERRDQMAGHLWSHRARWIKLGMGAVARARLGRAWGESYLLAYMGH